MGGKGESRCSELSPVRRGGAGPRPRALLLLQRSWTWARQRWRGKGLWTMQRTGGNFRCRVRARPPMIFAFGRADR